MIAVLTKQLTDSMVISIATPWAKSLSGRSLRLPLERHTATGARKRTWVQPLLASPYTSSTFLPLLVYLLLLGNSRKKTRKCLVHGFSTSNMMYKEFACSCATDLPSTINSPWWPPLAPERPQPRAPLKAPLARSTTIWWMKPSSDLGNDFFFTFSRRNTNQIIWEQWNTAEFTRHKKKCDFRRVIHCSHYLQTVLRFVFNTHLWHI